MILLAFCKFNFVSYAFIFLFDKLWKDSVIFSFSPKIYFAQNVYKYELFWTKYCRFFVLM